MGPAYYSGNVTSTLQEAVVFHTAVKLDEAAQLYDAVLIVEPDHPDALHLLGIVAFQRDQLESAVELIRGAIAADSRAPEYFNSLGGVLIQLNEFEDAAFYLEQALALKAEYPEALVNLGIAHFGDGAIHEVTALFWQGIELRPQYAQAWAALALITFNDSDFEDARGHLRRAADMDPRYGYGRSCVFGEEYESLTDPARLGALLDDAPRLDGALPDASQSGLVVATACDHKYFRQFGRALATSLDRNAPGHDLHFHIFNPERSFEPELHDLAHGLTNTRVTASFETVTGADRSYFANVRFARLYQILEACGRDLLQLDTDSLVRGNLDELTAADNLAHVAIRLRPNRPEIAQQVLATSVFVRNTDPSRAFLGRVAAYMLSSARDNRLTWYLDQCVFHIAERMMEFSGAGPVLSPLPAAFADSDFAASSPIWAAKGDRNSNPVFTAEAAKLLS